MQDLTAVAATDIKTKLALAGFGLLMVVLAFFAVRWQIGDMIAGSTDPLSPDAVQIADAAQSLAPSDPMVKRLASASAIGDQTSGFEETVRTAPYDVRWRVDLGRSYENDDRLDEAEKQFKKAVEIAPNYGYPHWHLGNFYLRQGRNDEALAELKKAAENNIAYRDQAFSLVWDFFGKDAGKVEGIASDRADGKIGLAYFFAAHGRGDDALKVWNRLSDAEKAANPATARAIALGLFDQKHFPQSLEFSKQLGADADSQPETVTNGSFEKSLTDEPDSHFAWQYLRTEGKMEASADGKVKHDGDRSLKVTFRNFIKPALSNLLQTVVVVPGRRYKLTFWLRTENLKSGGEPLLQILSANDEKLLGQTQPFPSGTNDWQQFAVDFTTPENCSGISIRTARAACGDECPINGVFWYDDFVLNK